MNYCYGCMESIKPEEVVCPHCGWDNSHTHNKENLLREGRVLNGKYLVGRTLGRGGFGVTYLGLELELNIKVAIKEYFPGSLSSRTSSSSMIRVNSSGQDDFERFMKGREAFQKEAQNLALFNSPSIAHVREFFRENNTAYIVMDYVDGQGLSDEIKRLGRMPWERVVLLMMPLMRELDKLHKKNLLHRDIKPDNIRIVKDRDSGEERLVLLDFGAARFYVSTELSGNYTAIVTHGYAPLEQYKMRSRQGPYTDVYSLCATMYKAITGETPPPSLDLIDGEERLMPFEDFGLKIPKAIEETILHGMALQGRNRPQTMQELYDEFEAALGPDDRDEIYWSASKLLRSGTKEDLEKAEALFKQIPGWKDADALAVKCRIRISELISQNSAHPEIPVQKQETDDAAENRKKAPVPIDQNPLLPIIKAFLCLAYAIYLYGSCVISYSEGKLSTGIGFTVFGLVNTLLSLKKGKSGWILLLAGFAEIIAGVYMFNAYISDSRTYIDTILIGGFISEAFFNLALLLYNRNAEVGIRKRKAYRIWSVILIFVCLFLVISIRANLYGNGNYAIADVIWKIFGFLAE